MMRCTAPLRLGIDTTAGATEVTVPIRALDLCEALGLLDDSRVHETAGLVETAAQDRRRFDNRVVHRGRPASPVPMDRATAWERASTWGPASRGVWRYL